MKFYHIFKSGKRRAVGVTVALEVVEGENNGDAVTVHCGVAYCAPLERNFKRAMGREIAGNRLNTAKEQPQHKRFTFVTDSEKNLRSKVFNELLARSAITWATLIISKELDKIGDLRKDARISKQNGKGKVDCHPDRKHIISLMRNGCSMRYIEDTLRHFYPSNVDRQVSSSTLAKFKREYNIQVVR
jgi:hypothetical protein